jgi:hypothetical protein
VLRKTASNDELWDSAVNTVYEAEQIATKRLASLLGSMYLELGSLVNHSILENLIHSGLPADLSPLLGIPNLRTIRGSDTVERDDRSDVIGKLRSRGVVVELISSVVI